MSAGRRIRLAAILAALVLGVTEIALFAIYLFNPGGVFDPRFYASIHDGFTVQHPVLGWVSHDGGPRPVTAAEQAMPVCVHAFGGSFTHADDMADDETWASVLSRRLGCRVANYGGGGYGGDQAHLRHAVLLDGAAERPGVVIFGIYQEMLRRNLAGSWVFYCCAGRKDLVKPYFHDDGVVLRHVAPPEATDRASMRRHHAHDRYRALFEIGFPYSVSILRNLALRADRERFERISLLPRRTSFDDPQARALQLAIMERTVEAARGVGQEIIFVYLPHPQDAFSLGENPAAAFIEASRARMPSAHHVDAFPAISEASKRRGSPMIGPTLHLDAGANRLVGELLAQEVEALLAGR